MTYLKIQQANLPAFLRNIPFVQIVKQGSCEYHFLRLQHDSTREMNPSVLAAKQTLKPARHFFYINLQ